MKYLKLFEEMKIDIKEFPFGGHNLSTREKKILKDFVGEYLYRFYIIVEDHYYYTRHDGYCNKFEGLNELKDYILICYYKDMNKPEEFLELLKTSKLDPSFDNNSPLRWARHYGHKEVVRLLLNDQRVRDKLTEEEINKYIKYTNETS